MLIEFRVGNFRSFRDEQTLSLVASNGDHKLEGNLIDAGKFKLVKAAGIYGANASGKSNLVQALDVMKGFVTRSATRMSQGDRIPDIVPFRLDAESRKQPTAFAVVLALEGTRYAYGFSATAEIVHEEWLTASPPGGKRQDWLHRQGEPDDWEFGPALKEESGMLRKRTRPNGLVLSRGAELNVENLVPLYSWFREQLWCFDFSLPTRFLAIQTTNWLKGNEARLVQVKQLLRHADLGIVDLELDERVVDFKELPAELKSDLSDEMKSRLSREGLHVIKVRPTHKAASSGETVPFELEEESNGTQRFFAMLGPVLDSLEDGAVFVADELECSVHPLLTRKLLELFQNPANNSKGAQLVFATHDTSLMRPDLLRRDQIWFTEKKASGATELFSLHDFGEEPGKKPRNNEAFERRYLAGRYGAVPNFGPALEDAELK